MPTSSSRVQDYVIQSDDLGETLSTRLYLPPDYSPLYTYPLVIALDGQDYFNLGRIATLLDEQIGNGELEKIIVCGIPYEDTKTRWHRYHPNGKSKHAFLHFLRRELLPALQNDVSVEALSSGVTLLGDSLGATVALTAALTYPLAFGNLILQSPFVNKELLTLCEAHLPNTLQIYHSVGRDETSVKTTFDENENFFEPNQELANLLNKKGLANYVFEAHHGDHNWKSWQGDLKKALIHFFKKA